MQVSKRLDFYWEKPVIVFYKERQETPERRAFAVVKAWKLVVSQREGETAWRGDITDFFPLMGDIDYISTSEGLSDRYILCWFDDEEDDFNKAWRRLMGVTFPNGVPFITDAEDKRTYNANFRAGKAKLKSKYR
jgi:hypothetical protein